MEIKLWPC